MSLWLAYGKRGCYSGMKGQIRKMTAQYCLYDERYAQLSSLAKALGLSRCPWMISKEYRHSGQKHRSPVSNF